ncbi:hypothetical protein BG000_009831 [Podila horticola]|nr:hypothetical protein BG000_009831 [Podila horticola]
MTIVEPIPIEPPAISVTVSELEVEQLRVADVSLFHSKTFTNWAGNQSCKPEHIYYPKTLDDIKRYVLRAKSEGKNLRCVGSGHSWSSTAITDEFMLNMTKMEKVHDPVYSNEEKSWTVEVETGVLVSDLDDVLSKHNLPLALPSNVVLESVRYGGILALGCHGAATKTRTLPDLVSQVTIVDATGTLNTFSHTKNPEEFSAATVNLGLLGVVYTYTLRVELEDYRLQTSHTFPLLRDALSVPEVHGPLLKQMVITNDQTEIFYWPFNSSGLDSKNDAIWVKQWQRTELLPSVSPSKEWFHELWQKLETCFGDKLYEVMPRHPALTPFLSCMMFNMTKGGDRDEVLEVRNAIHYQQGIDNIPCLDMEMAFKCDDNFGNVVRAWNYVIDQLYECAKGKEFPFNLTLEMRFVKSSSQIMSNAFDTDPEAIYCMMEILSIKDTKGFEGFSTNIAQYWMKEFHAIPHWAKMWEYIPHIKPYLVKQAGDRFDRFEVVRRKYDPTGMFVNKTFAGLVGPK